MKIAHLKFKIRFFFANWRMGVHLLIRTKRFGVNNEWWSSFDSLFGWPTWKIILSILTVRPIIDNYRSMKFRAQIGFVHSDTIKNLGWDK
jgi:hypothetical protein